jgi:hypothetical protein
MKKLAQDLDEKFNNVSRMLNNLNRKFSKDIGILGKIHKNLENHVKALSKSNLKIQWKLSPRD